MIRTVGQLRIVKGILGITGVIRHLIMDTGDFSLMTRGRIPPGGIQ